MSFLYLLASGYAFCRLALDDSRASADLNPRHYAIAQGSAFLSVGSAKETRSIALPKAKKALPWSLPGRLAFQPGTSITVSPDGIHVGKIRYTKMATQEAVKNFRGINARKAGHLFHGFLTASPPTTGRVTNFSNMNTNPKSQFYYYLPCGLLFSSHYLSPTLAQWRIPYFSYLKLLRARSK